MVDSPRSEASHESAGASGKTHASKDKQCQYCHQYFTSSSLGRHLDQFISRKKPDGVHNVEEIRRLRGGITRRTAKGNIKQDREGSNSTPYTTSPTTQDSPPRETREDLNATPVGGYRISLNAPNWQSTGVINGLPGSTTASPALENNTSSSGKRNYSSVETAAAKDILGLRGDLGSEKDTARALELALREVLDTINAARIRTAPPPSPFPVDIPSHSFPSLVLHFLPPPPTLLTSPIPFGTSTSFPLTSAPSQPHLHLLQSAIVSLATTWKSNHLHPSLPIPPSYTDPNSYASHLTSLAETHISNALDHLDLAYTHFRSLPYHQQQEMWQIELARAFITEKEKRKDRDEELEEIVVEARQLHGQVETLSRCQWPREMALWPPERRPIGKRIVENMERRDGKQGIRAANTTRSASGTANLDMRHRHDTHDDPDQQEEDSEDKTWDYDTLVGKWKKIVREDAVRKRGLTLPVPTTTTPVLLGGGGRGITALHPSPAIASIPVHLPQHYNPPASGPTPAPSPSTTATTTTTSTTTAATSTAKRKDQRSLPAFQPWSKRPKLLNGEECMIGIPVSDKQQQQQQQQRHQTGHQESQQTQTQAHGHNQSILRDLVSATTTAAATDTDAVPKTAQVRHSHDNRHQQPVKGFRQDNQYVYNGNGDANGERGTIGENGQQQQRYANGSANVNGNGIANSTGYGQGENGAGTRDALTEDR